MLEALDNVIQPYAWGSHTALAELLGEHSPCPTPQAELWMGAHPLAPSRLQRDGRTLLAAIDASPRSLLGEHVQAAYGAKLPFLLKVLAAASPLSLQAHPSQSQAEAGFAADEALGLPLNAPDRNYKDRNHKPELLCALGDFWALCGFREVPHTLALFDELQVDELAPYVALLKREPNAMGLKQLFSALMQESPEQRRQLAQRTREACRDRVSAAYSDELEWGSRLGALYPGDVGIVVALMLNLLKLKAGEAIYLPAGNLHAYLEGTGVEIMASSDNVLRGGLTPKHVNVVELLRVLDFNVLPVAPLQARLSGAEHVYLTPAREFQLSRFELALPALTLPVEGPEIWLVTSGTARLAAGDTELTLTSGRSAFVSGDTHSLTLAGERGQVFRARVPSNRRHPSAPPRFAGGTG